MPLTSSYRDKKIWISALTALFALGAIVYRCFFGADLLDESFAAAESYLAATGSYPFVNMWFPSGFAALTAPLIKLFLLCSGGSTEGIILFLRLAFVGCRLLTVLVFCLLFRKKYPFPALLLSAAFFLPLEYCNLLTWSYTLSSVYFLFLSTAFLVPTFWAETGRRRAQIYAAVSGVLAALSVLDHPALVVAFVLLLAVLLVYERREQKSWFRWISFLSGSVLTGAAVTGYMAVRAGGLSRVIQCVVNSLTLRPSPENTAPDPWKYCIEDVEMLSDTLAPWLCLLLGLLISFALFYIVLTLTKRKTVAWCVSLPVFLCLTVLAAAAYIKALPFRSSVCLGIYLLLGIVVLLGGVLLCRRKNASLLSFLLSEKLLFLLLTGALILYYVVLQFAFKGCIRTYLNTPVSVGLCWPPFLSALLLMPVAVRHHPDLKSTFVFLWGGALAWMLSMALLTDGISRRSPGMMGGMVCFLLFVLLLAPEMLETKKLPASVLSTGTSIFLVLMAVGNLFTYCYVENPFAELNTPVTQGVYKGLRTTSIRGSDLMGLEDTIRAHTSAGERVLFLDLVPYAYMMTDADACTPTAWDGSNYCRGANDDAWYLTYFDEYDTVPDKIIYIHITGFTKYVSIQEDDYAFNRYVHENYTLTFEDNDAPIPIKIYSRNTAAE